MNRELVDRVVHAVLYEGYMLYPYRPSVKNRQRWTFGGLLPQDYVAAHQTGDSSLMQTECLLIGDPQATLDITVRFLQVVERTVRQIDPPIRDWPTNIEPASRAVDSLEIEGRRHVPWQEAVEREIHIGPTPLANLRLQNSARQSFSFPPGHANEPLRDSAGNIVGFLTREHQAIEGIISVSMRQESDTLEKITIRIENQTPIPDVAAMTREQTLVHALISTHTILTTTGGKFVSLTNPGDEYRAAADGCKNTGAWPVLVGAEGETDTILASPIILYDYPQIAPESPGDLFDATEIDEILSLRILALSDDEKRQVAAIDERANAVLQRTEALARGQLASLHGALRGLRPVLTGEKT